MRIAARLLLPIGMIVLTACLGPIPPELQSDTNAKTVNLSPVASPTPGATATPSPSPPPAITQTTVNCHHYDSGNAVDGWLQITTFSSGDVTIWCKALINSTGNVGERTVAYVSGDPAIGSEECAPTAPANWRFVKVSGVRRFGYFDPSNPSQVFPSPGFAFSPSDCN